MRPTVDSYMRRAEVALFDALADLFGLSDEQAEDVIRYEWPNGESVKFDAGPDDDRCYLRITETDKPATGCINTSYTPTVNGITARQEMHICLHVDAVIYGPHAFDYAHRFIMGLMMPRARAKLRTADMAPISADQIPQHNPECTDGVWYERYDAEIDLYALVAYTHDVPAAVQQPDIVIKKG